MKGTDVHDQKAIYYRFNHKTKNWTHRIYTHFLMTAMVNAHILFCDKRGIKISFKHFLHAAMYELAGETKHKWRRFSNSDAESSDSDYEDD